MKTNTNRFGHHKLAALVTAITLAVALVLPAARSYAAPDTPGPVDLHKAVALTVVPSGDEAMQKDLKDNAKLEIDLYKVADATGYDGSDGYTFTALAAFKGLEERMRDTSINAAGWQQLAQEAADLVLVKNASGVQSSRITIAPDTKVDTFNSGLYLVVAHGQGMTIEEYLSTMPEEESESGEESGDTSARMATTAKSSTYEYYFLPELVALPGRDVKVDEEDGSLTLGLWDYDVIMTLKPQRELSVGPLKIVKTLDTYENHNETTFVFQVEIMDSDPATNPKAQKIYSSAVSLSFNAPGTREYVIENLPVGAVATVSEVYSGEDYKLIDPASKVQTVTIDVHQEDDGSGNIVELIYGQVNYANTYNKTIRGGGSVSNKFTHSGEEGASWTWEGTRDDGKKYTLTPAPAPVQ